MVAVNIGSGVLAVSVGLAEIIVIRVIIKVAHSARLGLISVWLAGV